MAQTLTAAQAKAIDRPGTHRVDHNLYLQIRAGGTCSWVARYMIDGKSRTMGLGSARWVPMSEAQKKVRRIQVDVQDGIDPLAVKRKERRAAKVVGTATTFAWCAQQFIASHEAAWRNAKHRAQWESTLKAHAGPIIGSMPVDQIGVDEVYRVLNPLWRKMPETASRLRGRIEAVLGWAAAKGYRSGANPAQWKSGALEHLLPAIGKVQTITPRASVPYAECPGLMRALGKLGSTSSRALRFTVLTSARTSEALGARWEEFDLEAKTWSIPGERMKAGLPHTVPLSDAAIALLGPKGTSGYVFPGARPGKPLSNMSMLMCLRGVRDDGATVHGLRSSFRTWAAEMTTHPREVAEMCLAHNVGSAVELAYQRSDFLAKRRTVMDDWAAYVTA